MIGSISVGMEIINLTPHDIVVERDGERHTIPASGTVARVNFNPVRQRNIDWEYGECFPVVFNEPGEIEGLPEMNTTTLYIVSAIVLSQTGRRDVFAPDTGPTAIRNDKGQIQAVQRFVSAKQCRGKCSFCGEVDDLADLNPHICYMCGEGMAEEA